MPKIKRLGISQRSKTARAMGYISTMTTPAMMPAQIQKGADHQNDDHAGEILCGITGIITEKLVHDCVSNGEGCAAFPVQIRLYATKHQHKKRNS